MKKADKNLLSGSTHPSGTLPASSGDKYGYEMIAELEARSDHTFTLKEGTLYPIPPHTGEGRSGEVLRKEAPTGRMRKYYRITRKGLRLLDEKKGGVGGIYPYRQRHSGRNQSGPGMSAPAAAPHRTISQFCDHVCMYVRFRPDHEAITAELTAHLEDHKAAILETRPDMPLREAERRAVEAMGNPEELGRWLDSIHNPLLGWLQIWFVRAVVLAGVLMLLFPCPGWEPSRSICWPRPRTTVWVDWAVPWSGPPRKKSWWTSGRRVPGRGRATPSPFTGRWCWTWEMSRPSTTC